MLRCASRIGSPMPLFLCLVYGAEPARRGATSQRASGAPTTEQHRRNHTGVKGSRHGTATAWGLRWQSARRQPD
jgi:hypothetical protein